MATKKKGTTAIKIEGCTFIGSPAVEQNQLDVIKIVAEGLLELAKALNVEQAPLLVVKQ